MKVPEFAQPEQARLYVDAVTRGDERAIRLLDEAISEAKAQGAGAEHLARLERERAARIERLSAYNGH